MVQALQDLLLCKCLEQRNGSKEIASAIRLVTWLELTTKQQASNYKRKKISWSQRWLLPGKSLTVHCYKVKRLTDQAMPAADATTLQQLIIHQFCLTT